MTNKLKISKILAWIAFAIYVVSLFLPYILISYSSFYGQTIYESIIGLDFLLSFSVLVGILFLFFIVKHHVVFKWLIVIFSLLFFLFCIAFSYTIIEVKLYGTDGHGEELGAGFYLCIIASILFLIASIIKFRIPVSNKTQPNNELIDDFHRGHV